jgi:hypothetical protein
MLIRIDALDADIAELDTAIGEMIAPFAPVVERLDEIPGVGITAARVIIAEVGLDMSSLSFFRVSHGRLMPLVYHRGSRPGKKTAKVFRAVVQPCVPVPDSPPLLLEIFRSPR